MIISWIFTIIISRRVHPRVREVLNPDDHADTRVAAWGWCWE